MQVTNNEASTTKSQEKTATHKQNRMSRLILGEETTDKTARIAVLIIGSLMFVNTKAAIRVAGVFILGTICITIWKLCIKNGIITSNVGSFFGSKAEKKEEEINTKTPPFEPPSSVENPPIHVDSNGDVGDHA